MRLTHALDALHAREVLGAWPRQEADLGGAPVELGAQMVRRVDADHRLAEEGDAITQAVGFVEVMGAEEYRSALAAQRDDEFAHRLGGVGIESGRRLVEEEDPWLVQRGARDGHLLLHAA